MDDVFPCSLLPQKSPEQLQGGDERIKEGGNLSLVTQWKAGWTVSDLSMVTTGRWRTICLLAPFSFFLCVSLPLCLLHHFSAPSCQGWLDRRSIRHWSLNGEVEWEIWVRRENETVSRFYSIYHLLPPRGSFFFLHWQDGSSGPNDTRRDIMALHKRGIKVTPAEMVKPTWQVSKGFIHSPPPRPLPPPPKKRLKELKRNITPCWLAKLQ